MGIAARRRADKKKMASQDEQRPIKAMKKNPKTKTNGDWLKPKQP